jgi:hypothetical protein
MNVATSLAGLTEMHPELEWPEIAPATVAALEDHGREAPFEAELELIDVPGFGSERLSLAIDPTGIPADHVRGCGGPTNALAASSWPPLPWLRWDSIMEAVTRSLTWPYAAAAPTIW